MGACGREHKLYLENGGRSKCDRLTANRDCLAIRAREFYRQSVLEIRAEDMRPLPAEASPQHCAEAVATNGDRQIILLSCAKILYEQEKQCLAALQATMETRLHNLANLAG